MKDPAELQSNIGSKNIFHGTHPENSKLLHLHAGNLSMIYENGALRYISSGKTELLRMIYPAVRDRNWLTLTPLTENEKAEATDNSFRVSYSCLYRSGEMTFHASYVIEGNRDNSLILVMHGEAMTRFEKNRIGFCVLHPIEECAGKPCIIGHTEGSTEESLFPEEISPKQVFLDIKSMKWPAEGLSCTVDFEGDVFETEDQRNWTDASYKTYSTPLSVPFPVTLEMGTRIFQKVTFRVSGRFSPADNPDQATVIKLLPEETFRLPSIGICRSNRAIPVSREEIKILRAACFDHYRTDLHLFDNNWEDIAAPACSESADLGIPLELALFFDDKADRQISRFIKWLSVRRTSVSSVLLFHRDHPSTPDIFANDLIQLFRNAYPDIRIATGTNANFAQLNRFRPGDCKNDSVCYSIHPQEHASDDTTLIENIAAQAYTVKSARTIAGNKGIIVSPVTIRRRFNANNTYIEIPGTGEDMTQQADDPLMSLFGACWTAGSLKYLCESEADSITYFEATGERGIIRDGTNLKPSGGMQLQGGRILPVYHVLRYLLRNKELKGIKTISSRPLFAECIALSDGRQVKLILVNFAGSLQPVSLECCSGLFRISSLNSETAASASKNYRWSGNENRKTFKSQSTFTLDPYSVNFIEGWLRH